MPLEKEKGWGHRMNKQQLAQKIWASANQMRSKIEANEYKDYILGFIFYKYLSDKEVKFLKENDYDNELLKTVSEEDAETVEWIQKNMRAPQTGTRMFAFCHACGFSAARAANRRDGR